PGTPLVLDETSISFPAPLNKIGPGDYFAQAVMDFQRGDRISYAAADGNAYSRYERVDFKPQESGTIRLAITELYRSDPFRESEHVKLVGFESPLLSKFHGQPIRHRAAVILPSSYARDTNRRYPVIYSIPGFGGTIAGASRIAVQNQTSVAGVDMIYVV